MRNESVPLICSIGGLVAGVGFVRFCSILIDDNMFIFIIIWNREPKSKMRCSKKNIILILFQSKKTRLLNGRERQAIGISEWSGINL